MKKRPPPIWTGYQRIEDSPSPTDETSPLCSPNEPSVSRRYGTALGVTPREKYEREGARPVESSDAVEEDDLRGAVEDVAPPVSSSAVSEVGASKTDVLGATGGMPDPVKESDREAKSNATPLSEADKKGLFSESEYFKHHRFGEQALKGFSFMDVGDLDGVAMTWPDGEKFHSTNPYFLRGLAVTYFYQSKMAKARRLLLKVWKTIQDMDVALMLAECACAIEDEEPETFEGALRRVCRFVTDSDIPATSYHIYYLFERLRDNGRFMGCIILRYALYLKRCKAKPGILQLAVLRFTLLKTSAELLSKVINYVEADTTQLDKAILFIFEQLKIKGITGSPYPLKRYYMEAFSNNCLAWTCMRNKKYDRGMSYTNKGISIMDEAFEAGRVQFMLYGDLLLNAAALLIEQEELFGEEEAFCDCAKSVYRKTMVDHPDENSKSRAIAACKQARATSMKYIRASI